MSWNRLTVFWFVLFQIQWAYTMFYHAPALRTARSELLDCHLSTVPPPSHDLP